MRGMIKKTGPPFMTNMVDMGTEMTFEYKNDCSE